MAFTTIPGASATDATSFVGTDGVDILTAFSTATAFVGAQLANDVITVSNPTGLINWTVKGGAGGDTLNGNSDLIGGQWNGNAGTDDVNLKGVLGGAKVLGGADGDRIDATNVSASSINGNKGNDFITVVGSLSSATLFGGEGTDNIAVTSAGTDAITNSLISGDKGGAAITITAAGATTISGVTITGGEGVDVIDASAAASGTPSATDEGFLIQGFEGNDTLRGSDRNDTIEGGAGDDSITGNKGADVLSGGSGDSNKFFTTAADTVVGLTVGTSVKAYDLITDFRALNAAGTKIDELDITGITAGALTAAGASYATVDEALKNETIAAGSVELVAIGNAGSFKSYLLINDTAAGATANGIIQIGETVYSTVAAATTITGVAAVVAAANIV